MRVAVVACLVLCVAGCGGGDQTRGKMTVVARGLAGTDVTSATFTVVASNQLCDSAPIASETVAVPAGADAASATFNLPPGTYRVCASLTTVDGAISATWSVSPVTASVTSGATVTETLTLRCSGSCPDGGAGTGVDAAADDVASPDGSDAAGAGGGGSGGGGRGGGGSGGGGGTAGSGGAGGVGGNGGGGVGSGGSSDGGGAGSGGSSDGGAGETGPGAKTQLFAMVSSATGELSLEVADAATWTQVRKVALTASGVNLTTALTGGGFAGPLLVAPSGRRAYWGSKIIDATTGVVSQGLSGGSGMALSPDGAILYVTEQGVDLRDSSTTPTLVWVVAIDANTQTVKDTVSFDGSFSGPMVLSPDGGMLVVGSYSRATNNPPEVRFIHTRSTMGVDTTVPVTLAPTVPYGAVVQAALRAPLFVPDGRVLFWDGMGEVLYVFDSGTKTQLSSIVPVPLPNYGGLGGWAHCNSGNCTAYDPLTTDVFVPRRGFVLMGVSLTKGMYVSSVAVNMEAPPLLEPRGGGSPYMPVVSGGASATLASVVTGATVYTFGGTGVTAAALANVQ